MRWERIVAFKALMSEMIPVGIKDEVPAVAP